MTYRVHLFGNFRLVSPSGEELTPTQPRHRALLALIASSEDLRRSRRWIEDRLWSTRGQKQASGSFREALRVLRKDLKDHARILGANRSDVWLDPDEVQKHVSVSDSLVQREFLEGLDVPDPEFEDWLRSMRAQFEDGGPPTAQPASTPTRALARPAKGILVRSKTGFAANRAEGMASRLVADYIATNFEDWFGSWLLSTDSGHAAGAADLEVSCDMLQDGGTCALDVKVSHIATGRVLYASQRGFAGAPLDAINQELVGGIVHAAASKVSSKLPHLLGVDRPEGVAAGFAHLGKQRLMTFAPENMEEAYSFMSHARQAHEHGVFIAWQAFIRMAQLVDSFCEDPEGKADDLRALSSDALALSGDNSLAVALVAIARSMSQIDPLESTQLAKRALKMNPTNLFARQAMALALSNAGDVDQAYLLSKSCQTFLPDDETRHLWDLYHALVCIAVGNNTEALVSAERASAECSEFIAPRRQLLGLYLHENRIDDAKVQFDMLRKKERDFSLDKFLNDPDYPVDTLRKRGLITGSFKDIFS